MDDERWIIVPNWDKFQHYHDRDPVWIKVYTELNSSADFCSLGVASRGALLTIWVEYARSRGQLTVEKCMQLCGKSARTSHFESLNHAGFIRFSASKPLALTRSQEKEVREEKKELGAKARKQPVDNSTAQKANVLPKDPVQAIKTMIANGVITDLVDLEAELQGFRLNSNVGDDLRKLLQ
jgi:hypothetical protein